MKLLLTMLLILNILFDAKTQNDSIFQINSDYNAILRTANNSFDLEDYYDAMVGYKKILAVNPNEKNVNLRYGISLLNTGFPKTSAIPYLKLSSALGELEAKFYLGKAYHLALGFDSSRMYFDYYKNFADKSLVKKLDVDRCIEQTYIAQKLMENPTDVKVKNAGNEINSIFSDYSPVLNADHSILYFTSTKPDPRNPTPDFSGRHFEDIYFATAEEYGWSDPINIGFPLNSKGHDATVSLSADGSFIVIYRTDAYTGLGDFYFSERTDNIWTVPVKMGMNINSIAQEYSASLSADAQILYFSSDRDGGFGGLDLYKSTRNKYGVWGKATNLGKNVNTAYDEDYPFIHVNGKDLFFSSKGHAENMGGYDIFKTNISDLGIWTKCINMGYPLNSTEDDMSFILSADGKKGYFCAARSGSIGGLDIFVAELKNDNLPICIFKGMTLDEITNKATSAAITIEETENGAIISTYKSDAKTGEFLVILPENKTYKITFEANNRRHTEIIDKIDIAHFRIIDKPIKLSVF